MVASTDPRISMPNAGSTKFARTTYATPSVIMIRKLVISSNPIPLIFFSIWVFSSSGGAGSGGRFDTPLPHDDVCSEYYHCRGDCQGLFLLHLDPWGVKVYSSFN